MGDLTRDEEVTIERVERARERETEVTLDDLIDAESEAEVEIRRVLIALEQKTGMNLNYVRVICPTLEVDVSLKPREPATRGF